MHLKEGFSFWRKVDTDVREGVPHDPVCNQARNFLGIQNSNLM